VNPLNGECGLSVANTNLAHLTFLSFETEKSPVRPTNAAEYCFRDIQHRVSNSMTTIRTADACWPYKGLYIHPTLREWSGALKDRAPLRNVPV